MTDIPTQLSNTKSGGSSGYLQLPSNSCFGMMGLVALCVQVDYSC